MNAPRFCVDHHRPSNTPTSRVDEEEVLVRLPFEKPSPNLIPALAYLHHYCGCHNWTRTQLQYAPVRHKQVASVALC